MLCNHAWTDLFCTVFELPRMGLRQGREVGDLSLCSGMTGTEHKPEVGIRVYGVLDTEDPDTVPGTLIPTFIIIGGNKGIPCGTDQGNTALELCLPLQSGVLREKDRERLGPETIWSW